MSNEILHKQIVEKFNSIFSDPLPEVPDYVADNLGHKLRPYQNTLYRSLFLHKKSIKLICTLIIYFFIWQQDQEKRSF